MERELRHPVGAVEFNALALGLVVRHLANPWWNLRWAEYDRPGRLFFATRSGRLTPASGKVPCLYLARNRETSFNEIYGDVIDAVQKHHRPAMFSRRELKGRVYLKTMGRLTVKLYDLTAVTSAKKIGMDLATLYTAAIEFPREFAQRLHDHPEKFDGIQYVSRHTQALCVVLWATHSPALRSIEMERTQSLWDLASFRKARSPGELQLFDASISVASAT